MTRNMQEVSDEMLMALADGELDAATAVQLMARVQADPALAARYGIFAETRALLAEAWETSDPVPAHLVAAIMGTREAEAPLIPEAADTARILPFRRITRAQALPMAIAASLLMAVGIGGFLIGQGTTPQHVASGPEAAAIVLAAVPTGGEAVLPDGTTVRALGSYATDAGLCRLIAIDDGRAVVCKDASVGWKVALAIAGPGQGGFLPASDIGTELVESVLDALGAGAALDPAAESSALAP